PLGALAAQASAEGYERGEAPSPYHGYYFRILKGQGPDAPGGALNYVVKGKMIGGFALIAWPAEYGNSGIMTFLVNHAGTVFQKDLGRRTEFVAQRTTLRNLGRMTRRAWVTSIAFIALSAVALPTPPALAQASGPVRIQIAKAGLIVGAGAGSGVLTWRGRNYPFRVTGLSIGITAG
ncbi:hypothetical protein KXV85_003357, partial [Aspergillus fumigatus]